VGETCPLCGAPLHPEQEWCLRCGAAARTRLAASPNWKTPIAVIAAVIALSLGVLAAALVKLAGGSSTTPAAITTTVTTVPTTAIPTKTLPGTTSTGGALGGATTTTPGAATTPGAITTPGAVTTPRATTTLGSTTTPGAKTPSGAAVPGASVPRTTPSGLSKVQAHTTFPGTNIPLPTARRVVTPTSKR
jgi:hypothetical protein